MGEKFKNWFEMVQALSSYDSIYNGRYVYPHTDNSKKDLVVFYAILVALSIDSSIKEYFEFMDREIRAVNFDDDNCIFTFSNSSRVTIDKCSFEKNDSDLNIRSSLGAIVPGYVLIENHFYKSFSMYPNPELINGYIVKYRDIFNDIYGKAPIVFEHGSNNHNVEKSSSVDTAHIHVVNHRYSDESWIIKRLNLQIVPNIDEAFERGKEKNYIMYMNNDGVIYYSDEFVPESQILRKAIASDIGKPGSWNWREKGNENFENCFQTVRDVLVYRMRKQGNPRFRG